MDTDLVQRALNNHAPLEEDLPHIRSLRQQSEATRDNIDDEIAALMMKRKAVEEDLKLYDSLLAPIKRVPTDILSIIFQMTLHIPERRGKAHRPPLRIIPSQVCRYWRHLALDMPILWSNIRITPPSHPLLLDRDEPLPLAESRWRKWMMQLLEITTLWIQRSQQMPLSVVLRLSTTGQHALGGVERPYAPEASAPQYAALVELACSVSRRWSSLDLDIATEYPAIFSSLIKITPEDVPQLRVIRFQAGAAYRRVDRALDPRGLLTSRALRTLTVVHFYHPVTDLCANWEGMTDLRFGVEAGRNKVFGEIRSEIGQAIQLPDALTLIRSCPNLRRCELSVSGPRDPMPLGSAQDQEKRVTHHHLQNLSFHGYEPSQDLVKLLDLPALRHLYLLSSLAGKSVPVNRLALSYRFLYIVDRFGSQLTSIQFNLLLLDNTTMVVQCFTNLPNLSHLELDSSAPSHNASPAKRLMLDSFQQVTTYLITLLTHGLEAEEMNAVQLQTADTRVH
ncbi:hypothetical protein NMY22_g15729 [Coprinellus aureogranulatus]|nr:hypothetical protein NMY22_g15729 [Coprinellus aureogranulatus]